MSRFLSRQLRSAESKPLGRVDSAGKKRADAAKRPPLVTQEMTPVGRTSGVCKPGTEKDGER